MKRKFFLSLLLISYMISYADDWSRLGYKGIGTKSTISDNSGYGGYDTEKYIFDISGKLLEITSNRYGSNFSAKSLTPTSTGFSGSCETNDVDGKITITKGEKGITKIFVKYGTGSFTITNTYDSEGKLSKKVYDATWYEEEEITYESNIGSELNRFSKNQNSTLNKYSNRQQENVEKYKKKMESAMARGDMDAYKKAYDEYMKASSSNVDDYMNESNRNVNSYMSNARAGIKTKKVKHTEHSVYTFSDYVFDEFGNWISRKASSENGVSEENQDILYDSEFWSKYYWEKLEKEGDLRKIEAFALHPNCHKTYKKLAVAYWNQHILKEVEQVDNNNIDSLYHVSQSPIIMPLQKDSALNMVREELYNKKIMPIRDFNVVREKKTMVYNKIPIFDQAYQNRIEARSMELYTDSVRYLTNKAQKELDGGDNISAIETVKQITLIDKNNQDAFNICHEARHRRIVEKEVDGSVKETDYKEFIEAYPKSEYLKETQNNRALYASSLFGKGTTNEELERVLALPTDEPTHNIVKKRYKKWMFKNNHGRFFHIGVGGEFAYGPANVATSGELTTRLGYTCHILNATIGVKYNYLTSSSQMFKSPKEAGNAYFDSHNLSIPVMLRLNFKHGYHGATYFGAGAELDVYTISSRLRDVEKIKDKKFADSKFRVTPRVALGGRILGIELELFATYELNNPFDVDYIKNYTMEDGQNIQAACKEKAYKKQIDGNKFFDKVRGGIALRIWF